MVFEALGAFVVMYGRVGAIEQNVFMQVGNDNACCAFAFPSALGLVKLLVPLPGMVTVGCASF